MLMTMPALDPITIDENVEALKKTIMENCRITIREVGEDVGILVGSYHAVFLDVLGMKEFNPKLLNLDFACS